MEPICEKKWFETILIIFSINTKYFLALATVQQAPAPALTPTRQVVINLEASIQLYTRISIGCLRQWQLSPE